MLTAPTAVTPRLGGSAPVHLDVPRQSFTQRFAIFTPATKPSTLLSLGGDTET